LTPASWNSALVASSKVAAGLGGLAPALELGHQAYNDYSPVALPVLGRPEHIALNPDDPKQSEEVWTRYGQLNPNLYAAPEAAVAQPQPTGQPDKPAAVPYQRMTQAQIEAQKNAPIQDEPVN
jgi:hypothetical protein